MLPGLIPSGCRTAQAYCACVIDASASIAARTSLRLCSARAGLTNGSNEEGARGRPATMAACGRLSACACREKYVCAAASTPNAWLP